MKKVHQIQGVTQWYNEIPLREGFYNFIKSTSLPNIDNSGEVYKELIKSVVSQQLSVKAAATIYARFLSIFPDNMLIPAQLLESSIDQLRAVGCSRQKASYMHNITQFFTDHELFDFDWSSLTDVEIIALLTQIKGVGVWTVQMVLIFCLQRPDVFAPNDLVIQKSMQEIYELKLEKKALQQEMIMISDAWSPHRSLVCRYLWAWNDRGNVSKSQNSI